MKPNNESCEETHQKPESSPVIARVTVSVMVVSVTKVMNNAIKAVEYFVSTLNQPSSQRSLAILHIESFRETVIVLISSAAS